MIKHISFDFWSTLASPNPEFSKARNEYLSKFFNIPVNEMKEIYTIVKTRLDSSAEETGIQGGVLDAILELCKEAGKTINDKTYILYELKHWLNHLFFIHQPIFPDGMVEAINDLRTKGYSTNITSNTNFISGNTLRRCDKMERMCFHFMLFSDIMKMAKPNKDLFQEIIYNMELSPCEILHIGDNENADIKGAQSVGFQTILVKNPEETLSVIHNLLK